MSSRCEDSASAEFQTLLKRARSGSQDAARELYESYGKHVLRCVRHRLWRRMRTRFDSQDFEQQVWASVFLADELPSFHSPDEFIGFLLTLAERKVYHESRRHSLQKQDVHRELPIDEQATEVGLHPAAADPTPSAIAVYDEEYDRLIGQQEPEVREVAQLRLAGNTFREIADSLEMDERTARRFMNRVKRVARPDADSTEP